MMDGKTLKIHGTDVNGNKGHEHEKVNLPAYQPSNPLQVITWMSQIAKKYSTISIPEVYANAYDQFPLGVLLDRNI